MLPRELRYALGGNGSESGIIIFSIPNLLRSLVWMAPKLEKILAIEAELDGRRSSIIARSH